MPGKGFVTELSGFSAIGPATATLAPKVISATVTVSYVPYFNAQAVVFTGGFTLDPSDPNYSHDRSVVISAVDPDGNIFPLVTITGNPVASPAIYDTTNGPTIAQPSTIQTGWSLVFDTLNEDGTPTPNPYTLTGITVASAALTAITGVEVGPVYQDGNQGLHTIIELTPTIAGAQVPMEVTFYVDQKLGTGYQSQGWFPINTVGQSVQFGQRNPTVANPQGGGGIWVPTDPANGTWNIAAFPGATSEPTPPAGSVFGTMTVAVAQPTSAFDCTNIHFVANPVTGDLINYISVGNGQYHWTFNELDWTQPTADFDPYYQYSMITVQKGYSSTGTATISGVSLEDFGSTFTASQAGFVIHVNGVWNTIATFVDAHHLTLTNAATSGSGVPYEIWNQAPDWEGADGDADLLWRGRGPIADSGNPSGGAELLGSVVQVFGDSPPDWGFPPDNNPDGSTNVYRTYRFLNYAVSRLGQDPNGGPETGTYTLQVGWPGGADHFDLTIAAQPSSLDLSASTTASLGPGVKKQTGTGKPMQALGLGMTFDSFNNAVVNAGYTMRVDPSTGQLVVSNLPAVFGLPSLPNAAYPQGAVIIDTSDHKIYRNVTGISWEASTNPADLVAGALASGVTVNAAQVNAGTFNGFTFNGCVLDLNLNGITTTINNTFNVPVGAVAGLRMLDNANGWDSVLTPQTISFVPPGSGSGGAVGALGLQPAGGGAYCGTLHMVNTGTNATVVLSASSTGSLSLFCPAAPPVINIQGTQVLTSQQTGPGNASGFADSAAQTWANNLLTALRNHGLVT